LASGFSHALREILHTPRLGVVLAAGGALTLAASIPGTGPLSLVVLLPSVLLFGYGVAYTRGVILTAALTASPELPRLSDVSGHWRRGWGATILMLMPILPVMLASYFALIVISNVVDVGGLLRAAPMATTYGLMVVLGPLIAFLQIAVFARYAYDDRAASAFRYVAIAKGAWRLRTEAVPLMIAALLVLWAYVLLYQAIGAGLGMSLATWPQAAVRIITGNASLPDIVIVVLQAVLSVLSFLGTLVIAHMAGQYGRLAYVGPAGRTSAST
jgi:hypothetical protein